MWGRVYTCRTRARDVRRARERAEHDPEPGREPWVVFSNSQPTGAKVRKDI